MSTPFGVFFSVNAKSYLYKGFSFLSLGISQR